MIILSFLICFVILLALIMGVAIYDIGMIFLNRYSTKMQKWLFGFTSFFNHGYYKDSQYRYNSRYNNTEDSPPNPSRQFHQPFNYNEDYKNDQNNQTEFKEISPILIGHLSHFIHIIYRRGKPCQPKVNDTIFNNSYEGKRKEKVVK
jgi:hypothetical protein